MNAPKSHRRKLDLKNGRVDLSHGAGGRAMAQLIEDIFHKAFDNDWLRAGNDQSAFDAPQGRMVMTTDGYVVTPLFFPGGDIGSLAVHGTINDIAMAGARPLISPPASSSKKALRSPISTGSPARWARPRATPACRSSLATQKSSSAARPTACSSRLPASASRRRVSPFSSDAVRPGDAVLISGSIGDHGVAIMSKRENLEFETEIVSEFGGAARARRRRWSRRAATASA